VLSDSMESQLNFIVHECRGGNENRPMISSLFRGTRSCKLGGLGEVFAVRRIPVPRTKSPNALNGDNASSKNKYARRVAPRGSPRISTATVVGKEIPGSS